MKVEYFNNIKHELQNILSGKGEVKYGNTPVTLEEAKKQADWLQKKSLSKIKKH